jgi:crossover junction endodeoxyribonuclease RuvC
MNRTSSWLGFSLQFAPVYDGKNALEHFPQRCRAKPQRLTQLSAKESCTGWLLETSQHCGKCSKLNRKYIMRVFGIDCGTEVTGYGVVTCEDKGRERRLVAETLGGIRLPKSQPLPQRLALLFAELTSLLKVWQPDVVAIEEVFYSVNAKSALKLGQVRGVALLAAASQEVSVAEYAPLVIKSSVVGYGLAKKEQVQFMVARLLELEQLPEPADAADALAIAICHIHTAQTHLAQGAIR